MYIPLITATLMHLGIYFSPNIKRLTENRILKSVYHIAFVLCSLFVVPVVKLLLSDSPVSASEQTGSYFFYLAIPVLLFVCVKRFWCKRAS